MSVIGLTDLYIKHRRELFELERKTGDVFCGKLKITAPIAYKHVEKAEKKNKFILRKISEFDADGLIKVLESELDAGVDKLLMCILNRIFHVGLGLYDDCFDLKGYEKVLKWMSIKGVGCKNGNVIRLNDNGFRVCKCNRRCMKNYKSNCLYKLLECCLMIKRFIIDMNIRFNDVKYIVDNVIKIINNRNKESWTAVDSYNNLILLRYAYLISDLIYIEEGTPASNNSAIDLSISNLSISIKYVNTVLIIINSISMIDGYSFIIEKFNKICNDNFNIFMCNYIGYKNKINGLVKAFYYNINKETLFDKDKTNAPQFTLKSHIKPPINNDIIQVAKLLLDGDNDIDTLWFVITLLAEYFLNSKFKVGFLKCIKPCDCFICTCKFLLLYNGLTDVLTMLTKRNVYTYHINLVKILINNELDLLRAYFFSNITDVNTFKFTINKNTTSTHRIPKSVKHITNVIHVKLIDNILKKCKQRLNDVSLAAANLECPVYIKLLSAIKRNLYNIDTQDAIDKIINNTNVHLMFEHLYTFNSTGRLNIVDLNSIKFEGGNRILTDIYLDNSTFTDCLSTLKVSDKLNIAERTHACMVLSNNSHLLPTIIPQLLQALVVDPGNRILDLILQSLDNYDIKCKLPYHLSCFIHSNYNLPINEKLILIMILVIKKLKDLGQNVYINQISFHLKLLALNSSLVEIPPESRQQELLYNIEKIKNDTLFYDDNTEMELDMNSVKILQSATRVPFAVVYNVLDHMDLGYIYKMNDDLRQDCLVNQLKGYMVELFKKYNIHVFLQPFLVLPCSNILHYFITDDLPNIDESKLQFGGIVGFIPDTISRHAIGKEYSSLKNFFKVTFGDVNSIKYQIAINNFIKSLAGYSLLCYLLLIKDRHNGNLLLSKRGHIIHIDFGFILGTSPAADMPFEQAPFKLTKDMIDLLGGINSHHFKSFVHLLVDAYLVIRHHSETFIKLVELLQYSNVSCFRNRTIAKLRRRFHLNLTATQAKDTMLKLINSAVHSKTTFLYDVVQEIQQGIER